jgi:nucleotide-binding universal stress UspA family protein
VTFVLGYDDSAPAQAALDAAIDLAARYHEPLVVVFGVAPPGREGEEFRALEDAIADLGREVTQVALERAAQAGVEARVELVAERPASALIDVADAVDARMIVVGTHGEGSLRASIMGSTTYRLLHLARRPVVVVPASRSDDVG